LVGLLQGAPEQRWRIERRDGIEQWRDECAIDRAYAYWGGSITTGQIANAVFKDVIDAIPIRLDGTSGQATTVRIIQRTGATGTSVQAQIVKR
jgi:hypothetical protein